MSHVFFFFSDLIFLNLESNLKFSFFRNETFLVIFIHCGIPLMEENRHLGQLKESSRFPNNQICGVHSVSKTSKKVSLEIVG